MIALLAATIVDVTVVLSFALAAVTILRRKSAAIRHAVLAAAVAAALAAPLFEQLVPAWPVELPRSTSTAAVSTLQWATAPPPAPVELEAPVSAPPLPWTRLAFLLWLAGAAVVFAGLAAGIARLVLMTRRCVVLDVGPWRDLASELASRGRLRRPVSLLQSDDPSLLLTWGLLRPRIVLPAGADTWTAERREVVLAHEFAHIRRHDWAWQMAGESLRALHWFNPLAWVVCRRLRHDSEYACDDAVLEGGVEPTEYASHLLEVARQAIGYRTWASAPAIANPSTLERRISAMLTEQRNRTALTRRAGALAAACAIVVSVPVAAVSVTSRADGPLPVVAAQPDVTLAAPATADAPIAAMPEAARSPGRTAAPPTSAAQRQPATFAGVVMDPSGGVLPGVEMAVTDTEVGVRYTAITDGAGSFAFLELQPGRYELVARLPGFAPISNVFRLEAGGRLDRRLTLPLGTLEETIRVVCSTGAAAVPGADLRVVAYGGRAQASAGGGVNASLWTRLDPPPAPAFAAQDTSAVKPIRVGGQIKAPNKIKDVNPVCPRNVMPSGDTVVRLVGTIGVDGLMNEVRLAEPAAGAEIPPTEFVESALEATRQWGFTPTLLNNVAVPVHITITVLYQRR